MNFEIVILADTPTVKTDTGPTSPAVKHLLKEEEDEKLKAVPDDKTVYWVDLKKAYPDLENQIKPLFGGKDRISVKDLKNLITQMPKEQKFWISETTWDSDLQRELGMKHPQIVVQLNLGKPLINAIHADSVLSAFFKEISRMMGASDLHPTHSQTIAWARVYPMADKFVVEEIQSDVFGGSVKLKDVANTSIENVLKEFTAEEKAHIQGFLHEHFLDWDKKLLATVINLARKKGVNDIWIFDEDAKKVNLTSPSKLDRFYKVVPRDLGFKRGILEVDDQKFGGWHRVVASFLHRVTYAV